MIIYSDAYFSETVPYADLVLPDTTYLERWDCISPARPADLRARRPGRRHPPAGGGARPRRAPVPGRADRSRRPAEAAGHDQGGRLARSFPAAIPTTSSTTSAGPASARWPAIAARTAAIFGRGEANPRQLEQYIADGCFHVHHLPEHMRYYRHVNRDYIEWALDKGLRLTPHAGDLPALQRADAEDAAGRARPRRRACRPSSTARASRPISIRCRSGIRRSRARRSTRASSRCMPSRSGRWRCTTRWGSQNAWLRQIHGANRLYMQPRARRAARHRRRRLGVDREPHRPREARRSS